MFCKSLAAVLGLLAAMAATAQQAPDKDIVVTDTRGGSGWQQATSKHFVVYSNDTPQNVGRYAVRLERLDKAIRVLHGTPEDNRGAASRVTVYVLDSVSDVQKVARRAGIAGFYQPRLKPVAFMPRNGGEGSDFGLTPQVIMFHEYTHHWMLTTWTGAAFPAWYTEGNAELHATAMVRDTGVTFGAVPVYRRYGVSWSDVMPADRLLGALPSNLSDREAAALYGRGWLLTHYLTFDNDRRKLLAEYVSAINSGKSISEAAKLFGSTTALDGRLNGYGQRQALPSITLPMSDLPIEPVVVRNLPAGEAAAIPMLIRSNAGVDKGAAAAVVADARRAAALFPDDAAVQNELAEAEYDAASTGPDTDRAAGYARASTAADRAIAADTKSVHALVYKGMAEQALALEAKKTDAATWTAVRRWYLQANRVDTEDPDPLLAYYRSFVAAKQAPTPGAVKGLYYAYALAPHDSETRMLAATSYLREGKVADARVAIAPIAYRPELAGADRYRKVLTALDANDTKGALAELEKNADEDAAKKSGNKKDGDKEKS